MQVSQINIGANAVGAQITTQFKGAQFSGAMVQERQGRGGAHNGAMDGSAGGKTPAQASDSLPPAAPPLTAAVTQGADSLKWRNFYKSSIDRRASTFEGRMTQFHANILFASVKDKAERGPIQRRAPAW